VSWRCKRVVIVGEGLLGGKQKSENAIVQKFWS
jgi:hypothetical protein